MRENTEYTYDDPISMENKTIDDTTIIYLVKIADAFSIKAISDGIDQLTVDPISRATYYWRIVTKKLLEQKDNELIFIGNELTSSTLTPLQVQEFLGIDTNTMMPTLFDPQGEIAHQLHQQYAHHMDAHFNPDAVNVPAQQHNPHFFNPAPAPMPLFPLFITRLAGCVGLPPQQIMDMFQNNVHDYHRLNRLSEYITNSHTGINLHASLTIQDALAITDQEEINLCTSYPYVLDQGLTLDEARALTENERMIFISIDRREERLAEYHSVHNAGSGVAP